MIRWLKVFLVGVTVFTFFSVKTPVNADLVPSAQVYINDTSITTGNNQYVTLRLVNANQIGSLDVSIYYDSKLTITNAYNEYMSYDAITDINYSTPGVIHFSLVSLSGISGQGGLFTFMISTGNAPINVYELDILVGDVYDINLNPVVVESTNTKINVVPRVAPKYYGSITSNVTETTIQKGDIFTYTLNSNNLNNITSGNVVISYDNTKIKVNKININPHFKNQSSVYSLNNDIQGTIQFSFASLLVVNNLNNILEVVFESMIDSNTSTSIDGKIENAYNCELDPIEFNSTSSQIQFTTVIEDTVHPKIKLTNHVGFSNEPFTIDVIIEPNSGIAAGSFEINYDMFYFSITEIKVGGDVSDTGGIVMTNPNVDYGSVKFSYINENGLYVGQTLLKITFMPNYDNFKFTSPMTIQSIGDLVNEDYENVTLSYVNAEVSLTDALTYHYVDYDNTLLDSIKVLPTETPTPPSVTLRPNTTFDSWQMISTTKDSITYQATYKLSQNAYILNHTQKVYDQLPLNISAESTTIGATFDIQYSNDHKVGIYDITVRSYLDGVYQYTVIHTGEITKKPINVIIDSLRIQYGLIPDYNFIIEGVLPGDDVLISFDETTETLGVNTIIPSIGNPNYDLSYNNATLTIEKASYDVSDLPTEALAVEYNGVPQKPILDGSLPEGFSYEIVGDSQINAGTYNYQLYITHNNPNYNQVAPIEIPFTIKPKTIEIVAEDKISKYSEAFVSLTYKVIGELHDDIEVHLSKTEGTAVGVYDIVVSVVDHPNYTFIKTNGQYRILGKIIDLSTIDVPTIYITYDGLPHTYEPELILPQGIQSLTFETHSYKDVGEYILSASWYVEEGFETIGTIEGLLIIQKATIEGVSFTDTKIIYDGSSHAPKINGLVTSYGDALTVSYPNMYEFKDAGTYQVTAVISHPSYISLEISTEFIIEKATRNLDDLSYIVTHNQILFSTIHASDLYVSVNLEPYVKITQLQGLEPDTSYQISLYLNETQNYLMSEMTDFNIKTYQSIDVVRQMITALGTIAVSSRTNIQLILLETLKLSPIDQETLNPSINEITTAYNQLINDLNGEYSGAVEMKIKLNLYVFTALIPSAFAVIHWRKRP